MILSISSELETFRSVCFNSNFNIILADQSEDSDEHESTNGLGKTTLLRIIHFCLGGDDKRDRVLSHPDLRGTSFTLRFGYHDVEVEVRRSTAPNSAVVQVTAGFVDGIPVEVSESSRGLVTISVDDWGKVLTARLLDRSIPNGDPGRLGSPTFREIAHYLIRLEKPAFVEPLTAYAGQRGPIKRLVAAYMLGLNWEDQRAIQLDTAARDEVSKAAKVMESTASAESQSLGDLEADRVVMAESIAAKEREVSDFQILENYEDLEKELIDIDEQLHAKINLQHNENRLLNHYRSDITELPEPNDERLLSLFESARSVFKEGVLRRIDEVREFHSQVHRNRRSFLNAEVSRIRDELGVLRDEIRELSARKAELLRVLSTSGALDSFVEIQRSLNEMKSNFEVLKARIEDRKRFDTQKDILSRRLAERRAALRNDLEDRRARADEAIALFAQYTGFLYGRPGRLSIEVGPAGYKINFSIEREGSDGVEQMVVFCFDLMIATLRARANCKFNVLIHDSGIFADVDPRQVGLALQLAERTATVEGFQFIACLNVGSLRTATLGSLVIDEHVRLRLSDDQIASRLLGVQLSRQE